MLYRPSFEKLAGERFRVSSFVWRRPRVTAYYENLRDCTPSNECGALSLFFEVVEALSIALVPCHRSLLGSAELEKCKPRFPSVFVSRKYPSAILAGLPSTENSRNSRPLKQCACEGKMGCHHRGNAMLDFTRDTLDEGSSLQATKQAPTWSNRPCAASGVSQEQAGASLNCKVVELTCSVTAFLPDAASRTGLR